MNAMANSAALAASVSDNMKIKALSTHYFRENRQAFGQLLTDGSLAILVPAVRLCVRPMNITVSWPTAIFSI